MGMAAKIAALQSSFPQLYDALIGQVLWERSRRISNILLPPTLGMPLTVRQSRACIV
jgi:hypothetical protein